MRAASKRKPDVEWTGQVVMAVVGKKKAKVEPESSVLKRVTELLWTLGGIEVMRNRIGFDRRACRHYGLGTGSSDIVCIVAPFGRWLCVETKRGDGGVVSNDQETWLAKMRTYGAVAGVAITNEEVLALVALARQPARDT